ncbi:hypothetical protein N7519_008161 [Penicillium mononematosum]|uniref:uncharacterized protein n=1 Tax=Penicillium mononematosum TaxID=268346 RepID=UPI00254822D0|nr:uncharacterized protein N7519_008161 [Penicillium mononematosum]KAJ6177700.1 hypothetical protein N7519_008161 [Penicillium mononematosum]
MLDNSGSDLECFETLPDTFKAAGPTADVIRTCMAQHIKTIRVVKYLRFTNVPPSVVERDFSKSTKMMYNYETRSLILKLVDGAHETMKATIQLALPHALYNMGLEQSIMLTGSARVRGGSCFKEPDGSWVPWSHLPGRDRKWPTVVMEVGVSESIEKLKADAAWWLANSVGQVKLVIIVSINQTSPEVTFQTIVLDTATAIPTVRQSVSTSRAPKQPDAPIITSPAEPLIIRFEEMLCRQPVPPEQDLQIPLDWLERASRYAWMEQQL